MSQSVTPPVQNTLASNGSAQGAKPATQQPEQGKGQPQQAAAVESAKRKLKIDGIEQELTQEQIDRLAMLGAGSSKRFQEAAEIRRRAEDIVKQADEDPAGFFSKRGKNIREWAENYLIQELRREQMSPEQKKAWENEQKLKQYEEDKKRDADQKRQDDILAKQKEHHDNYQKLFIEALGKTGLPRTAYTMKRMAELQLTNLKLKREGKTSELVSADRLAQLVREDYISEQKSLFGSIEGDQLLEILGPEIVKKLSKAQIAKLKAKGTRPAAAGNSPTKDKEQMSWREYQLKNRRRTA